MGFSITTLKEQTAFNIVLMDTMKAYCSYEITTLYGIPSITLEGSTQDWQLILDRVQLLRYYGLDWWCDCLVPILEEFVKASQNIVDKEFWLSIYKRQNESGGPYIKGWCIKFFPYIQTIDKKLMTFNAIFNRESIPLKTTKNPYIDKQPDEILGLTTEFFPNGLSKAPFKWFYAKQTEDVQTFDMDFVVGFMGITQNSNSKALKPEIAWAITEAKV